MAALSKSTPKDQIAVVLPKYASIDENLFPLKLHPGKIRIPVAGRIEEGFVWSLNDRPRLRRRGESSQIPIPPNLTFYFIENKKFFSRSSLYRAPDGKDYADNDERFIFFSRAVLEFCKFVDFAPDIIHAHDWQTGLIPAYLSTVYQYDSFFHKTVSVFTIHNIAYQGMFPKKTFTAAGFDPAEFVPEKLEFFDHVNFLKAGLVFSNKISTVSPTYAKEVQTSSEFGRGMEGVLKTRAKDFTGILNGLDYQIWDPASDPHLPVNFSAKAKDIAQKKAACKKDLQDTLGLPAEVNIPVFGMVSRLDAQKGFDLVCDALPELLEEGREFQCAILGQGDPAIEKLLKDLIKLYPHKIALSTAFNEPLAHKIYAGSDFFLMPSVFEPCGLSQMISMAYGTLPVATPTGGLLDTVEPWNPESRRGNGLMCDNISVPDLVLAMEKALRLYGVPSDRQKIMQNALSARFSWEDSAQKYLDLYSSAILSHLRNSV